ncbi:Uncharacterised protein [Raoultella planticola]|uniref:Uncharacterized protein n=1 Tax=Raoultella planticola TaxID=575 RepID=A0A485B4Y2_RAOPL|nr:Uncharacterised protein [Raoultella planticola]
MTTAVTIKNITFQEGATLICVPLIGQTLDELKAHALTLAEAGPILSNGASTTLSASMTSSRSCWR